MEMSEREGEVDRDVMEMSESERERTGRERRDGDQLTEKKTDTKTDRQKDRQTDTR